ncbi:hypothetical protein Q670_09225 [Alcanivorax sp. P2S70]|uniref:Uncharacterized protein n=1 Tax=Alcanivorax profundi TaxID=2338368 RepID=A0A418Y2L8_9GAMM|nr:MULTISPECIES: hypothetical protein [Alcanivorax]ERP92347.1 hypothetical protein Q670_09225 [Alcanivorax sp. P2S70]MCG8427389.1 hypothetical protein [Chromatiales bacterium]RJG19782.1 hypothetical protein D4A39_02745 [Alcanivorax profundi]
MNSNLTRNGFIAAALMNIGGVMLFSRAFTNDAINQADPVVMSNFGLMMIVVWGLAYLGAAFVRGDLRWLAAAFAVEKLVYVVAWSVWMSSHSLGAVYEQDLFAGVFYSIYGLNDLAFMVFFGWVALTQRSHD